MLAWLIPLLVFIGGLLLAIFRELLIISSRLGQVSATVDSHAETLKCIPALERDMALHNYRREVEDRELATRAAQELHSPHTPREDRLLERFKEGTIQGEEWIELEPIIEYAADHEKDRDKRIAARMVLGRVRFEAAKSRGEFEIPEVPDGC